MDKNRLLLGLKYFLLLLVLVIGLYFRFEDLGGWKARYASLFYLDDRPLFTSYDAFWFARLAKDYQEGLYDFGDRDPFKFVPDNYLTENFTYPLLPMESFLAAGTARLFGISIEKFALYFTPVAAVLFAIPLFVYLNRLGYPLAGLMGGLVGVTSLIYLIRTSIVRFDTDSLNLFFPFTIAFFLWNYFRSSRPLFQALGASVASLLFYWWYSKAHLILVLYAAFLVRLFWERGKKLTSLDWKALGILILPQIWYLWQAPWGLYKQIMGYVINITSSASQRGIFSGFPNVLQSISELQSAPGLKGVAYFCLNHQFLLILGLLGAFLLFIKRFRDLLFLLPYFAIGLLTFRSGNRFAMYLAPFIGMGLGFLLEEVLAQGKGLRPDGSFGNRLLREAVVLGLGVLLGAVVVLSQSKSLAYTAVPKVLAPLARDMEALQEKTPREAWIYTWWDLGYAFQYLSRRPTFIDGGSQGTPKTYFVALSFTTPSQEKAYHVTAFLAEKGLKGLREILEESGKDAEEVVADIVSGKYVQRLSHPVYWVFTPDLPAKFGWIHYFGSWDFKKKKGTFGFVRPVEGCRPAKKNLLACRGMLLDLEKGLVIQGLKALKLKEIVIKKGDVLSRKSLASKGLILEIAQEKGRTYFYLVDEKSFVSNFNQMYILRRYDPRYFQLVWDDFPTMVVYRVREDDNILAGPDR
ncbi:STT3 domain-containing protein [Thermosulfurimonas dismutans]|uniref:Oligosaccharyltransferase PglB n=1 Tax=Thermosulfurimonas dismutans TaxID=999894 RepID=A0A179D3D8_9BACT|nr:STT3 domain-containing protein [Thermosulfurimonas dismutans]OAQ20229.1 Oligosaccharyltransferase PglB [Thermosulfurimonas dismutans]